MFWPTEGTTRAVRGPPSGGHCGRPPVRVQIGGRPQGPPLGGPKNVLVVASVGKNMAPL